MTASMKALCRRAWLRLKTAADRTLELKTRPEHHAVCLAWRDRTGSRRYEGRWAGPGVCRLNGFYDDGRVAVATVEWEAPPPGIKGTSR